MMPTRKKCDKKLEKIVATVGLGSLTLCVILFLIIEHHLPFHSDLPGALKSKARYAARTMDLLDDGDMFLAVSKTEPHYFAFTFDPAKEAISANMHQHSLANRGIIHALSAALRATGGKCGAVVDAGAGLGSFGLYALHRGCEKVHFFEMQKPMAALLRKSIKINQWTERGKVYDGAISSTENEKRWYINQPQDPGAAALWIPVRKGESPVPLGTIEVYTTRFDTHINGKVFFMQLDLQGFEMEAIESCWKLFHEGKVEHVSVTIQPNQADEVVYTLYGYGYRCRSIRGLSELGVHSLVNEMQSKDELMKNLRNFPENALAELWCTYTGRQNLPKSTDGNNEEIAKEPVLYHKRLRFLVAHGTIPLYDVKGADARLLTVLEALRLDGHHLDLIGMTSDQVTPAHLSFYRSRGYRLHEHPDSLTDSLRFQEIDIVLVTYSNPVSYQQWIHGIVNKMKSQNDKVKIVVLTGDVPWRTIQREFHGQPDVDARVKEVKDNEVALYQQASVVAAMNANDQLGHLALMPELPTCILRFAVGQSFINDVLPPWGSRHGLLFVASNLRTNSDSLHWFLQEVWPMIKSKFSQADLLFHVAGEVGVADQFRSDSAVVIHGHLAQEQLFDLYRSCRVFVSPMLHGTGLNIKAVHALNHGLPIVTTTPGVDQLEVPLGNTDRRKYAVICPVMDVKCFSEKIYDLYYDRSLWDNLVENGRSLVELFFNPTFLRQDLRKLLSIADNKFAVIASTTTAAPPLRGFPGLKNAVTPKEKERGKVYIGLMVYESARTLGREAIALLSTIDLLGRDKVFVSMLTTSGGSDNTEQLLEDLHLILKGRNIPSEYTATKHGRQGYFENRVAYLAQERNLVLEPLLRSENQDFSKVLFLNDIIFDPRDLVRLIDTKVEYDMVCGMDFSFATMNIYPNGTMNDDGPMGLRFYDMWATKDMSGNFFRNSAPFNSELDEGLGAWVSNNNWYSTEPVRVLSCWNGAVVFRASAFTKDGIRFRADRPGECPSSECTWWSKDLIANGYDRIYINPAVRFAYEDTVWLNLLETYPVRYDVPSNQGESHRHAFIQQVTWPNKAICCPAKKDGAEWHSCYWTSTLVPPTSGAVGIRPKRLSIVYQGPIYRPIESFAIINRHLLLWFSRDPELLITVLPTDREEARAAKDPPFPPDHWHSVVRHVHPQSTLPIEADVWIRSGWPALFHPVQNCVGKCRLIIFQPWEFGSIPKEWAENISRYVWQMWVPSNEVRKMYTKSGVPREKIMITPHAVNLWEFYGSKSERPESLSEYISSKKKFKFLFHGGLLERKGIDILLDAYLKEFTKDDDVSLIVHYTYVRKDLKLEHFLNRFSQPNAPEVVWMQRELKLEELARLYASVDTYVLPYRSEGFGIPIIEAMASALPVIVTDKGAAEDFTSDATAFLVASSEQKCSVYPCVDQTICVFCKNDDCQCKETVHTPSWYEPDANSLMKVMRYVYTHPNDRQTRTKAAEEVIEKHFTWDTVAPKIIRQLKTSVHEADIQLAKSQANSSNSNPGSNLGGGNNQDNPQAAKDPNRPKVDQPALAAMGNQLGKNI